MVSEQYHVIEPPDALDDLPEALAQFAQQIIAGAEATATLAKALAALAAVWAITEEDVAAEVHACIYEPDDDAWGATEDPTTLDAAHVVLNHVTRAITNHINPDTFTRKD